MSDPVVPTKAGTQLIPAFAEMSGKCPITDRSVAQPLYRKFTINKYCSDYSYFYNSPGLGNTC
jgi:hypothetical protein